MSRTGGRETGGAPVGTRVLELLVSDGKITPFTQERILHYAERNDMRIEDALIDSGEIGEEDLLRYLAGAYKTRFVSTLKLSQATIPPATLKLVPHKVALWLGVLPILFDRPRQLLSVVASDAENAFDTAKQVQVASGVREVKVYIARPAAVQAAIMKHYEGRPDAFDDLLHGGAEEPGISLPPEVRDYGHNFAEEDTPSAVVPAIPDPRLIRLAAKSPLEPQVEKPQGENLRISGVDLPIPSLEPQVVSKPPDEIGPDAYLETINVLVAVIEQSREELRGHSAQVARQVRKICERMSLPNERVYPIVLAAYLHDLGKVSTYHLTALNVAQYEGHRIQAQKTYLAPLRLFESVQLPAETTRILTHLYERFDGKGFPDKLGGKDVPIGSRILAVVETYSDLTAHAKNPYRKKLAAKEAVDVITRYKGQFFDPNMIDMVRLLVLGDDLKARLEGERRVLLVDPDPEETTVLEMRLIEHGFQVSIARNAADGVEIVRSGGVDAIVTEVDLKPTDGFELVRKVRDLDKGGDVPVLFLTRKGDGASVTRGFELGAADYLVKPAPADVVVAKAKRIFEKKKAPVARGVSGSLTEMALPDVIQILANGRKSGVLTIQADGKSGEVFFLEGAICDARFGEHRGDDAFYRMMKVTEGDFVLDTTRAPTDRSMNASTETLLLEAMRRIDEGLV